MSGHDCIIEVIEFIYRGKRKYNTGRATANKFEDNDEDGDIEYEVYKTDENYEDDDTKHSNIINRNYDRQVRGP